MIAEIVSIGTELLMGQIADTNAQFLGRRLPSLGITHLHRQTVGDNLDRIVECIRLALSRADVVFTIGGLGPTQDDLTREAIGAAIGAELEFDESYAEKLRRLFSQRNLAWVDSQLRQAYRPHGALFLENANGSAPGLICPVGPKAVIALPGPKGEFVPMVEGAVLEYLSARASGEVIESRILRVCRLGESLVEDALKDLLASSNPTVAPYAKPGEVHVRLTAKAPNRDDTRRMLDPLEREVRDRLGWPVYDDRPLEAVCLDRLIARGWTLATAESVTGGGVAARITSIPGCSRAFRGAVVPYHADLKSVLLGVQKDLIRESGPVTTDCAIAMAEEGRHRLGATACLALTGNAGPETDIDGKPVGLVYVALATPERTWVEEYRFRSTREGNRERAEQAALTLLYRWLMDAMA